MMVNRLDFLGFAMVFGLMLGFCTASSWAGLTAKHLQERSAANRAYNQKIKNVQEEFQKGLSLYLEQKGPYPGAAKKKFNQLKAEHKREMVTLAMRQLYEANAALVSKRDSLKGSSKTTQPSSSGTLIKGAQKSGPADPGPTLDGSKLEKTAQFGQDPKSLQNKDDKKKKAQEVQDELNAPVVK